MRPNRPVLIAALCGSFAIAPGGWLSADEWPQWRGPNRDGAVENFRAPDDWPDSLTRVWRLDVGEGWSSPVLHDGRLIIHSRQGDEEWVRCLEQSSGEPVWEVHYPAAGSVHPAGAAHGVGPKSTPAIAGGRLFTLGIGSILSCMNVETGDLIWRQDFSDHFEKPAPSCGTSMSPLVIDGMCIVHVGVDAKGELIALDTETGARRWTYDGDGPGYGSPVVATLNGKRQLIAPVSRFMAGLSVEDGSLLWRHPFPTQSSQNILTPVIHDDRLIVGGIGQATAALRLSGEAPAMKVETIWTSSQAPLHMSSLVRVGDRLFGLTSRKKGQLFCANASSGEMIWTSDESLARHVTILHGDGHVMVLMNDGKLLILKSDSDSYEPLASYQVSDTRTWAHPLISGARIVIKDQNTLTCWSLSDSPTAE